MTSPAPESSTPKDVNFDARDMFQVSLLGRRNKYYFVATKRNSIGKQCRFKVGMVIAPKGYEIRDVIQKVQAKRHKHYGRSWVITVVPEWLLKREEADAAAKNSRSKREAKKA